METAVTENGLTITHDEETSSLSFEWDPETHPEYNQLENMTDEEFQKTLLEFIGKKETERDDLTTKLQNARYNRLHDAICEYIDEMEGEELVQVLASVLKKEIKYYTDKVDHLNVVLQKLNFNDWLQGNAWSMGTSRTLGYWGQRSCLSSWTPRQGWSVRSQRQIIS